LKTKKDRSGLPCHPRKAAIQRKPLDSRRAEAQRAEIRAILTGTPVQAKLRVGSPDNAHEREADAVADRVMRMPDNEIRRKPT
jgi:hypothetical protein